MRVWVCARIIGPADRSASAPWLLEIPFPRCRNRWAGTRWPPHKGEIMVSVKLDALSRGQSDGKEKSRWCGGRVISINRGSIVRSVGARSRRRRHVSEKLCSLEGGGGEVEAFGLFHGDSRLCKLRRGSTRKNQSFRKRSASTPWTLFLRKDT